MANASGKRLVEIPIDATGATPRERGSISYIYNTPEEPRGVFSFSYYYRPKPSVGNRNASLKEIAAKTFTYLKGMTEQNKLTRTASFPGWKTVIYTDNATIEALPSLPSTGLAPSNETARALFSDPNVIIAVCEWPEYSQSQTRDAIDGVILRVMRHKAMMDFPDVPVFVRDADTYFDFELFRDNYATRLEQWESLLFRNQQESGKHFLVAGTPSYMRGWHKNTKGGSFQSPGVLAGLVNSLGGIPEWKSGQLWHDSLSYIRGYCHINVELKQISNLYDATYVGKDEQIMIFIWIPTLLDRTFFLYFDFHNHGTEMGSYIFDWKIPKSRYYSIYEQLKSEFPEYLKPIRNSYMPGWGFPKEENRAGAPQMELNEIIGASPKFKLYTVSLGEPKALMGTPEASGTPPPGGLSPVWVPPPKKSAAELRTKMEEGFEHALQAGLLKQEDDYIFEYLTDEDSIDTLLNPFVVVHAFRNPVYQRIMYLMFEKVTGMYRTFCERRAAAPVENLTSPPQAHKGGRRRRATKKRVLSRRKYQLTRQGSRTRRH